MMKKRKPQSMYQYEPLVTPSNWNGEERQFVQRLTQLFDQLFSRKTASSEPVDLGDVVKTVNGIGPDDEGNVNVVGERGEPGETGPQGPPGEQGSPGEPGIGVPTGGTAGQMLAKKSEQDYDTEWVDAPTGSGAPIIQGGSVSGTGIEASSYIDIDVTFPTPFPEGVVPIVVVCFAQSSTAGTFGRCCCAVKTRSAINTGFTIRSYNGDSSKRSPSYRWIAVG